MKFEEYQPQKEYEAQSLKATHADADFCHVCGLPSRGDGFVHACVANVGFDHQIDGSEIHDPRIGQVVGGHYVIESRIGEGGMSIVYKAQHEILNQTVAIKLLKPMLSLDQQKLARFRQEALSVMKLNHPNIIRVYHFEIPLKSEPFLIMDYIDGQPLSDILEQDGRLSLQRTITIFSQVCDALAHAHESGVIHRDIKPSNIILCTNADGSETAKIVDFGIAKLADSDEDNAQNITRTGEVFGSPLYMSPEQCAAKKLDARSDIYSTACVIFESLTGQPPVLGGSALETMHKHVFDSPSSLTKLNPDMPNGSQVEAILLKALSKHPDHRYQSIADMKADLEDLSENPQSASIMGDAKTRYEIYKRQKNAQGKKDKAPSWVVPSLSISVLLLGALGFFAYNQFMHPAQDWQQLIVSGQQNFDKGELSTAKSQFQQALQQISKKKDGSVEEKISTLNELVDINLVAGTTDAGIASEIANLKQASGASVDEEKTITEVDSLTDTTDKTEATDALNRAIDQSVLAFKNKDYQADKTILEAVREKSASLLPGSRTERRAIYDLGVVDASLMQFPEARTYQEQALKLAADANDMSTVGKAHLALASLDFIANRQPSAIKHCDAAEEAFQNLNESSNQALCQEQRGLIYQRLARFSEAEAAFQQAIQTSKAIPVAERSAGALAGYQIDLANLYAQYMKRPEDALKLLPPVIASLESSEPKSMADWGLLNLALQNLAFVENQTGNQAGAANLCNRALAIAQRLFEPNTPSIAQALLLKAQIELDAKQKTAENSFILALSTTEKAYGADSAHTATCLLEMGRMYFREKRYMEAEKMLRRASSIFSKEASDKTARRSTLNLLSDCLNKVAKPQEAADIKKELDTE